MRTISPDGTGAKKNTGIASLHGPWQPVQSGKPAATLQRDAKGRESSPKGRESGNFPVTQGTRRHVGRGVATSEERGAAADWLISVENPERT
jgi:hypothetical protein